MTLVDILLWIITGVIVMPLVIYLCVKMAVLGYYRAREIVSKKDPNH
jgi:hypothetical protein